MKKAPSELIAGSDGALFSGVGPPSGAVRIRPSGGLWAAPVASGVSLTLPQPVRANTGPHRGAHGAALPGLSCAASGWPAGRAFRAGPVGPMPYLLFLLRPSR